MANQKKSEVTYDKCKLFYNQSSGSFYYQPWDKANDKWFGNGPGKEYNLLGTRETSIKLAQPFTDMMDAIKLMFGHQEFNLARMQALWSAYRGKHDLFASIERPQLFFPIKKEKKGTLL